MCIIFIDISNVQSKITGFLYGGQVEGSFEIN